MCNNPQVVQRSLRGAVAHELQAELGGKVDASTLVNVGSEKPWTLHVRLRSLEGPLPANSSTSHICAVGCAVGTAGDTLAGMSCAVGCAAGTAQPGGPPNPKES